MPLATYIENNLERLLSEWCRFARDNLSAASTLDDAELRGGAEAVLRSIVDDMRTVQSDEQRKARSHGTKTHSDPPITITAREHAAERLRSGFTLDQLVSEYRALRANVVRGWTTDVDPTDRRLLYELVRFDEAMDQSLTDAISWFNEGVERARNIFVGVLGHDLRDPLNAAMSATEVSLALENDPDRRRRISENALKSLVRMSNMIDGLLDFARTRLGGRLPISPAPADMRVLCSEIVEELALSQPGREVCVDYSGDLLGEWDAERIKQVVTNLTSNALDYGARKKPVRVTVCPSDNPNEILLSVHNEGTPIPKKEQATIFDPLVRGAVERDRTNQGRSADSMGLGLYIVRQITEAHGGTVEVVSDRARGTTFTVRLPRRST